MLLESSDTGAVALIVAPANCLCFISLSFCINLTGSGADNSSSDFSNLTGRAEIALDEKLPPVLDQILDKSSALMFEKATAFKSSRSSRASKFVARQLHGDAGLMKLLAVMRSFGWIVRTSNSFFHKKQYSRSFQLEKYVTNACIAADSGPTEPCHVISLSLYINLTATNNNNSSVNSSSDFSNLTGRAEIALD